MYEPEQGGSPDGDRYGITVAFLSGEPVAQGVDRKDFLLTPGSNLHIRNSNHDDFSMG